MRWGGWKGGGGVEDGGGWTGLGGFELWKRVDGGRGGNKPAFLL